MLDLTDHWCPCASGHSELCHLEAVLHNSSNWQCSEPRENIPDLSALFMHCETAILLVKWTTVTYTPSAQEIMVAIHLILVPLKEFRVLLVVLLLMSCLIARSLRTSFKRSCRPILSLKFTSNICINAWIQLKCKVTVWYFLHTLCL